MRELNTEPAPTLPSGNVTLGILNSGLIGIQGPYTNAVPTTAQGADSVWILASAGFIFLMQAGFALIEGGAVSKKNRNSMLIKNIYNVAITAIAFWLSGYGLAFGGAEFFVGQDKGSYASSGFEQVQTDNYVLWIIQFAYATVVISSFQGALAERT